MKNKPKCELCNDTGYYGDNGPGIKGNDEWNHCECRTVPKPDTCSQNHKSLANRHYHGCFECGKMFVK